MKPFRSSSDKMLCLMSMERLKKLVKEGKIKDAKDLCRNGFCPGILKL